MAEFTEEDHRRNRELQQDSRRKKDIERCLGSIGSVRADLSDVQETLKWLLGKPKNGRTMGRAFKAKEQLKDIAKDINAVLERVTRLA